MTKALNPRSKVGEHTPLACGIRRPAESTPALRLYPADLGNSLSGRARKSMREPGSGGPPDSARGPRTLPGSVASVRFIRCCLSLSLAVLVGCSRQTPPPAPPRPQSATNATTAFETRGIIRTLPEGGQTLVVRHEEIPGYMPKMTMELNVRNTNELRGLERDDEITFRLVATADTHWIENIQRVGHVASEPEGPKTNRIIIELRPGDLLPDATMIAEDGRKIHFSDFHGQAVAFTFLFTRCPLPDFCPRMGNNFARTRALLRVATNAPANWQLLSLSFDPEFDQPAVLAAYARAYRGSDTNHWLYAAATPELLETLAPQLDFMFARDAGGFSHNLRTVVLDPEGRIARQFDGNRWTPEELADAVIQAARQ